MADLKDIADRLIAAYDSATMLPRITAGTPDFSVADGYTVLHDIETRRRAQGWQPVGRKIGFTNRTIWPRYGVYQPMWAHVWTRTVHFARDGKATLPLQSFVQPRIEPEVVFKLKAPVPLTERSGGGAGERRMDGAGIRDRAEPFPGLEVFRSRLRSGVRAAWRAGGRRAGRRTDANRAALAAALPAFEVTLSRGDAVIDRGVGSNVLDSPALALAPSRPPAGRSAAGPKLAAGEIVTTGTITDAWPVAAGEIWSSDYGVLGLDGLTLRFTAQQS